MSADPWKQRVDAGDWAAITAEVSEYGGALLPELLTAGETEQIRGLYEDDGYFRATINMGRHRFGEGVLCEERIEKNHIEWLGGQPEIARRGLCTKQRFLLARRRLRRGR